MGLLDEPGLQRLIAAGCTACGGRKLLFRTYVEGFFPFMAGEPVGGRPRWAYDGEKFIDGVYAVACADCGAGLFSSDVCPRCHAAGGLAAALAALNTARVPPRCDDADCGGEEIRYLAFVPARVAYEGQRAEAARTSTEPHEEGFHGVASQCVSCGRATPTQRDPQRCPLCDGPGPLRVRPG